MVTIQEDGSLRCSLDGTSMEVSRSDERHIRIKHEYGDIILADETAIPFAKALLTYTLTSFALRVKYELLVLLG